MSIVNSRSKFPSLFEKVKQIVKNESLQPKCGAWQPFWEIKINKLTILIQLAFQGFVIRPGHENLVAMGAVSTIADDEILSVPAKKRNCYFQEEYKLELHRWVMEMLVV
jgi:hypothetical protein